jgi:NAD(P)-dependent dehydrogenase (short-subunit alcohol dehydrogenase family)
LVDRHPERAEETLGLLDDDLRDRAYYVRADVSIESDCEQLVHEVLDHSGKIDVLVNNVGIAGPAGNAIQVNLDEWERAMKVNLTSMVSTAKFAIPHMEQQGSGSIINISSVAATVPGMPSLFYPVSKGAIVPLTRSMAAQHGGAGVRVNCIAAGLVLTPMVVAHGINHETREARRLAAPLQSEGDAWDVAYGTLYLASDEARWVTGVVLPIDAGLSMGGRMPTYE